MIAIEAKLQRLASLRKQRPQYAEIYDFYQGLCTFLRDCRADWLKCSVDPGGWTPRRQAGFPLLTAETLQIDAVPAGAFLDRLCQQLADLGQQGADELQLVRKAIAADRLPVAKLLIACLEKDRAPLDAAAKTLQVPAPLLEYVCSSALAFALQQWRAGHPQPLFEDWQEGYCPICGGTPAMGELAGEEGSKRLHCALCATAWEVSRLKCSYCGNKETAALEYFTTEGDKGYRVDLCRKCSSYLKVVDSRELGADLPMDVEDLNTLHLDLVAQREGFSKGKRSLPGGSS